MTTVLDDAKAYANHAKKKGIDLDDVKLAVSMQMEQSFTSPPPREVKIELPIQIKLYSNPFLHLDSHGSCKIKKQHTSTFSETSLWYSSAT